MNIHRLSQIFVGLMGLAFANTGIQTLISPQAVLNNVGIVLDNTSALSSMRAVYGGMHLAFGIFCLIGILKGTKPALTLIAIYTAGFVVGRLSGILIDGAPNQFVITWLIVEAVCGSIAALLVWKQSPLTESTLQSKVA